MKPYYLIVLLITLFSCQENKDVKHSIRSEERKEVEASVSELDTATVLTSEEKRFQFEKWKDRFKFQNKSQCFNLDSLIHFENIINQPDYDWNQYSQVITGDLLRQIEGKDTIESWHDEIREETDFLYSIQEIEKFIGITIIGGNDWWANEIRYLTFDFKGNKISDIVLASKGGDGGYYFEGEGCFLNDSVYEFHYLDTEFDFEKEKTDTLSKGKISYKINESGLIEKTSTESIEQSSIKNL